MLTSEQLKKIVTETRPLIEQQLDLTEQVAGLREVVTAAGGDWSQLKALVKAQIQDERDDAGDGKRVRKILDKADYAQGYADMLGLGNLNEKNSFADADVTVEVRRFSKEEIAKGFAFDASTGEIIEGNEPASSEAQVRSERSGEGGEDAPALSADTQSQPGRSEAPRQIEAGLVAKVEDQSTAARKDVPGSLPVIENGPVLSDNGGRYPVNGEAKVLAASSEVPGTPAGTQAPPVDTPKKLIKLAPDRADEIGELLDLQQQREAAQ